MPDHESWIKLSLLLLLLAFSWLARAQKSLCGDGSNPMLVLNPTKLTLNRDTASRQVVVTCRHPSSQRSTYTSLTLNRTLDTSVTPERLVVADTDEVKDLHVISGTKASGSYSNAITFTMPGVSCSGAEQTFSCQSIATTRGSATPSTCIQAKRLRVESKTTDVRLTVEPEYSTYSVGDVLTLTCSATVGLAKEKVRAEWVWEKKRAGERWKPVTRNAFLSKLTTVDNCLKVRVTIFRTILKLSHNGLTYRCYTVKGAEAFTSTARSFSIVVDSFIFGLKTSHGTVVLIGIVIIFLAVLAGIFVGVRHFARYHVNKERAMYRERVMNRLDKLFRFEAELIGGVMKRRKSQQEQPLPEHPPLPPPEPKKRLEENEAVDPTEITIQLEMPEQKQKKPEPEPPDSPEQSEAESEAETDTDVDAYEPLGPMDKV